SMDGMLVPPADVLFAVRPMIENFIDNHALVQLNHRLVAYLLLAVALLHALDARLTGIIERQHVFFVASAAPGARVNLSPRGTEALRILSPNAVAYLD
uniref:hypothetical protein n=1 Tax=Klebsiella michiganensis TaxID=1134687 RepID=UPI001953427A